MSLSVYPPPLHFSLNSAPPLPYLYSDTRLGIGDVKRSVGFTFDPGNRNIRCCVTVLDEVRPVLPACFGPGINNGSQANEWLSLLYAGGQRKQNFALNFLIKIGLLSRVLIRYSRFYKWYPVTLKTGVGDACSFCVVLYCCSFGLIITASEFQIASFTM